MENIKNYTYLDDIAEFQTVVLEYPCIDCQEKFPLCVPITDEYAPLHDIYTTVQLIASDVVPEEYTELGDERNGIIRFIMKACHKKSGIDLIEGVKEFNKVLLDYRAKGIFEDMETKGPRASDDLIRHILEQSYARSIGPSAHLLNHYEGFSNNVYGEIKSIFVSEIIKQSNIESDSVFLDMGSGIGNVVLQVAAECLCDSYGIEIMETPSVFAKKQRTEFVSRMKYYGKPSGRIYLKQGDFLTDESISQVISKADVIFVNKYFVFLQ
jgi:hypothetical protein